MPSCVDRKTKITCWNKVIRFFSKKFGCQLLTTIMAFSAPATPKTPFVTSRRIQGLRVPNHQNEEISGTPTMANGSSITPRCLLKTHATNTPECFSAVTIETPSSAVRKISSGKENFDKISNLVVAIRIRPMNVRELSTVGSADVVRVKDQELIIRSSPTGNSTVSLDHLFHYDHIFWSCDESKPLYSSQEEVFLTMGKPLLNSAFRGYNACLFAYGQTGSGKSYSMMGRNTCEVVDIDSEEHSGVIPRFCRDLFHRISKLDPDSTASVEVSYFEIYSEKIHDLLLDQNMTHRKALKVREHPELGPYVVDLSVHTVKSYEELRDWLLMGNRLRATSATNMNEKSSRSHSIFTIELCLSQQSDEADSGLRSKVSLVDLAGSERLSSSNNNEEKIRQGVSINKSLLTLGKVISSLADQKKNHFVPYRESVLTWLLKESLGGNSLTSMLATITPANTHLDETLATLRYACQARSIVNRARINENPHDRLIRELRQEVQRLKALKMDYERTSLSSNSSAIAANDSDNSREELDELRCRLLDAENNLRKAESSWEQRFMDIARSQLEELTRSEQRREELESKVRIMKTVDTNVCVLSPYKTNFLEELEGVLTANQEEMMQTSDSVDNMMNWCSKNSLECMLTSSTLTVVDVVNKKQAFLQLKDIHNLMHYENISDFVSDLTWIDLPQNSRKLSKSDIMCSINQIYKALANLQPMENERYLNLLFAKVNKSVQSFEAALLNSVAKNGQKTVTFDL